jgi:hypothetical protein
MKPFIQRSYLEESRPREHLKSDLIIQVGQVMPDKSTRMVLVARYLSLMGTDVCTQGANFFVLLFYFLNTGGNAISSVNFTR